MVPWMRSGTVGPERIGAAVEDFRGDSTHVPAMLDYFRRDPIPEGTCLGCPEVFDDRSWYASDDYRVVFEPCGFDQTLWCFRPILGAGHDQNTGIVLVRAKGGRPFESRLLFLVREAHAAIAPMIGGPLARFADPSPMHLPQRARPVLACLLEGDGDKQIAARLGLSVHTVNEYTKAIYRHFGVRSRPELLARWIRRGWTSSSFESRPM